MEINKETKLNISIGCMEYLIAEVKQNRRQLEILQAENNVMNNFFGMIDRLGAPKSQGYGEDKFYQAKQELEKALLDLKK